MRRFLAVVLLLSGCKATTMPPAKSPGQNAPSGASPASMSHGEAKVDNAAVPLLRTADAPPRSTSRHQHIRMRTLHARHTVAPGVTYDAWTFDSVVPGPTIRVTVGDTVDFTLVNAGPIPHSIDFHAAEIAPSRAYVNVMPGDSIQFRFVPKVAGAFMYHCGTAPVALHISNGMYGAIIVDPVKPRPPAREYVLVQSEFYLGAASGPDSLHAINWQKMLDLSPDYVVFNGVAAQYAAHPIAVDPGDLVRFYVVNAGPNRQSSFHVVGGIFSQVFVDGTDIPWRGVQTASVPVGGGMIFETRLAEPGLYPFVTHAFADATKGGVGVLRAGNVTGKAEH
jgi:nitrite reductase (NO-forming)